MKDKLIQYFRKITSLSPEETKVLIESMEIKSYKKNDFLIEEGQYGNDTFFVLNGCVRQCKSVDGNDITTNFYTEEQWIVALDNSNTEAPSNYSLVCMEDTDVVIGNEQKAMELFEQFPRFEKTSRQIMETVFKEQQILLTSYITDKPEQRYLKLIETRPDIIQRVPQYDIATYIGVKPETLSRIRKNLAKKNP